MIVNGLTKFQSACSGKRVPLPADPEMVVLSCRGALKMYQTKPYNYKNGSVHFLEDKMKKGVVDNWQQMPTIKCLAGIC